MTKEIQLTQGKVALVDDEDFDELNRYKWHAHKDYKNGKFYASMSARCNGKTKTILMHRKILVDKYKIIDHINHDGLDNRKCNLRSCTCSQNHKHCIGHKNNKSGFNGVSWNKSNKKWMAQITKDNRQMCIGYFDDKKDAAKKVDEKAKELFGEFSALNFP
jgi:hypothetical protein